MCAFVLVIISINSRRSNFLHIFHFFNLTSCESNRRSETVCERLKTSEVHLSSSNMLSIVVQQDATICSLFISAECCTCFGRYLRLSSGAHITVSTVSGIIETTKEKITSKCLYYIHIT